MRVYPKSLPFRTTVGVMGCFLFLGLFYLHAMASDRFVVHGDGTVTDTKTSLMWATRDNGDAVNWQGAFNYCRNYSGGGHIDWRMPTLFELETLYDPEAKNEGGYHLTRRIHTSAASCWAADTRGHKAGRFNFTYGSVYWLRQSYSGRTRVLPVRRGR